MCERDSLQYKGNPPLTGGISARVYAGSGPSSTVRETSAGRNYGVYGRTTVLGD